MLMIKVTILIYEINISYAHHTDMFPSDAFKLNEES